MNRLFRHSGLLVSLLGLCFLCACNPSASSDQVEGPDAEPIEPGVQTADSIYWKKIDTTGLAYEVFSPRMIINYNGSVLTRQYPEGLEIVFYNRHDNSQSSISAGFASEDQNYITTLKNRVRIKSNKGDILETSYLLWDNKNRKLNTDKLIRLIQTNGDTTFGFGLQANEDFSRFKITKGYAGKIKFDDIKNKFNFN